ncbi:MAG: MMPL family transporter [Fidelibacterota bacterium]|nr:MAG: MMPL family transporter [Candidatus Neomarinimicrobiota bacterium]
MKKRFIDWTLNRPRQSIGLAVVMSLILVSGIWFLHIEDDIMKMLPEDIPSRIVWSEIEEQFGSTEPLLVSIGREGHSIFSAEGLAAVWDLTRTLEELPTVDDVRSLATMNRIDSDEGFLEVGDLMPYRDLKLEEIADIQDYLDRNSDIGGMLVSEDEFFAMLAVVPTINASDKELVQAVNEALGDNKEDENGHIGGLPFVRGILIKSVLWEIITLMCIAVPVLALILLINLRSPRGLRMVLPVIGLSVGTMLGFFCWMYKLTGSDLFNFSLVNGSMGVILLTIATADSVHIMTRFFREMRQRKDVKASVAATMDVLMLPVFLTSVTTMAGFISLVSSPLRTMIGYGITVSFGIAWAWYLSVTFLPSLMSISKWDLESRALQSVGTFERIIHRIGQYVLHKPRTVLVSAGLVVVIACIGIYMVRVEVNIINFFKPTTPIRQSMEFIDNHFYGTLNFAFKVEGDLKEPEVLKGMQRIQRQLEHEPTVGNTVSLANIIAKLHRAVMDDSAQYEIIPDSREKVANLLTLYSMSGDPDDFSSMVDYDYQTGLINATVKMSATEELIAMVDRIHNFVDTHKSPALNISLSGFPVFVRDFIQELIVSSLRSIGLSLILVMILAGIFFKSLRWGLVAVIPLSSAIALNFGLMGWLGIELSHVTALFTAIIIGVGVDFAVHYIAQYRNFLKSGVRRDEVSQITIDDVGYPILLNVAAVSVGFTALLFSEFVPLNYMGGLVIISMISCAIGTLTLMAAVIHLMRTRLSA